MEAAGVVTRIEGDEAVVELQARAGGCGRCDEPGGCRSGLLSDPFRQQCREYRVENSLGVAPGERVLLRIEDGRAWRAALLAYLMPALLLIGGAAAGRALFQGLSPDAAAAAGGAAGLLAALVALGLFQRRERRRGRFRPHLARTLAPLKTDN